MSGKDKLEEMVNSGGPREEKSIPKGTLEEK